MIDRLQIKGEVIRVGFREYLKGLGNSMDLPGLILNTQDNTVTVLTDGSKVDQFEETIREQSKMDAITANVDDIIRDKQDIDSQILPDKMTPIYSDELEVIEEKLAEGVGVLQEVKENTKYNSEVKNNTEMLVDGQEKLVDGQEKLVDGQEKMIDQQDRLYELLEERLPYDE